MWGCRARKAWRKPPPSPCETVATKHVHSGRHFNLINPLPGNTALGDCRSRCHQESLRVSIRVGMDVLWKILYLRSSRTTPMARPISSSALDSWPPRNVPHVLPIKLVALPNSPAARSKEAGSEIHRRLSPSRRSPTLRAAFSSTTVESSNPSFAPQHHARYRDIMNEGKAR